MGRERARSAAHKRGSVGHETKTDSTLRRKRCNLIELHQNLLQGEKGGRRWQRKVDVGRGAGRQWRWRALDRPNEGKGLKQHHSLGSPWTQSEDHTHGRDDAQMLQETLLLQQRGQRGQNVESERKKAKQAERRKEARTQRYAEQSCCGQRKEVRRGSA